MSKYFTDIEFACNCCGGLPFHGMNSLLLVILDKIRETLGQNVYVLSGYRCPSHNAKVGGVPDSQHLHGTAADITCYHIDVDKVAALAEKYGADGIGIYREQKFVHIDVRGYFARWEG